MTHVYCPSCGVRFTHATAVHLVACPVCGEPPQSAPSAGHLLGYRLAREDVDDFSAVLPVAVAVALPAPVRRSS
jgi:hypothetical protein